jgi:hypothetical protein
MKGEPMLRVQPSIAVTLGGRGQTDTFLLLAEC